MPRFEQWSELVPGIVIAATATPYRRPRFQGICLKLMAVFRVLGVRSLANYWCVYDDRLFRTQDGKRIRFKVQGKGNTREYLVIVET